MCKHIHLIGIGGAGLSAIATLLLQQGYNISGSDMYDSEVIMRLHGMGANVVIGHHADNITNPSVVVVSSAIPSHNPEIIAARKKGIPVYKRPTWLGMMMKNKRGICIAGSHGKTTTTAMIAWVLTKADLSPSFIVGGDILQLGTNAQAGLGDWFVIEADEYDYTFLSLKPEIAVITNIEWDHPDTYSTEDEFHQAFHDFAHLVPPHGQLIICADDSGGQALLREMPHAISYSSPPGASKLALTVKASLDPPWQATDIKPNEHGGYTFMAQGQEFSLRVPGKHNVQNALATIIVADKLGVPHADIAAYLMTYEGVGRRFQFKGEVNNITIIDDYAHHPTEIKATLEAARTRFGHRPIWAVCQPHTFSRTKLLLAEFATAFDEADHVIILDIYPSREKDDGTIHSTDLVSKMTHPHVQYIGKIPHATNYLQNHLQSGDVLLTLGAGDSYEVGEGVGSQK